MRLWVTLAVLTASAAAFGEPAGERVESVTEEARICTSGEVPPVGTLVRVVRRVCSPLDAKRIIARCHEAVVGRAPVLRADGPHCVIVQLSTMTTVQVGDRCEPEIETAAR
ncbi:MAG TPA: hypothetical protein VN947_26675 [Polyangia bacterium]|nr:hypothetical protein [Polyangia bacterium]